MPNSRQQSIRKAIGVVAFACVGAVLLVLVAHFTLMRRSTGREIVSLESARDKLQVIVERLETERNQAESEKRIVLNVLANCRIAEDIPDFQTNRVVARRQGLEKLCIYVPEGSHTLKILCKWKPTPSQGTSTKDDVPAGAGEKTWSVPLLPACGYCLTFDTDRKGGPIQWELTSNQPQFKTQAETVPFEGFSHQGSSWSGSDVVQFPNQIERFTIVELEAAAKVRPGVNLLDATLLGKHHDQPYELSINVRLLSDGPACVSATDAQRIIVMGRADLLLPYEGGGKYLLRTSETIKLAD